MNILGYILISPLVWFLGLALGLRLFRSNLSIDTFTFSFFLAFWGLLLILGAI